MSPKKKDEAIAKTTSMVPDFARGIDTPEEALKDNLRGRTPRLPQIRILHAGANCFQSPDGQKPDEIRGVILDHSPARAYWKQSFQDGGTGNRPDCSSVNGENPDPRAPSAQATRCADCENNQWGSALDEKGNPASGKACKEMARIHIITKDQMIPQRLTLPPSSLRNFDEYMTYLGSRGLHMNAVNTVFKAVEAANKQQIKFTSVEMSDDGYSVETEEEYRNLKKNRDSMLATMRGEEVLTEEYVKPEEGTPQVNPETGEQIPF